MRSLSRISKKLRKKVEDSFIIKVNGVDYDGSFLLISVPFLIFDS